MNANEVLANVNSLLETMPKKGCRISDVFEKLGIFDWWNENLSMTQLKQMKSFLEKAISLGFTGYVCFKVGASGCSHGMWACKNESTTGYSPDGACLFHSFRNGDNYWGYCDENNKWVNDDLTWKEIKEIVKGA